MLQRDPLGSIQESMNESQELKIPPDIDKRNKKRNTIISSQVKNL